MRIRNAPATDPAYPGVTAIPFGAPMNSQSPFHVLILCTGNSARSILAEALFNHLGQGRFRAWSAGSHPAGHVQPHALELIQSLGLPVDGLRSKSWDEFARPDAPHMDFIITVCDNAAGEVCPHWPGHPVSAHWGFPDPAAATGTDEEQRHAYARVLHGLSNRIRQFASLPLESLDALAIKGEMDRIGSAPIDTTERAQ